MLHFDPATNKEQVTINISQNIMKPIKNLKYYTFTYASHTSSLSTSIILVVSFHIKSLVFNMSPKLL